MYFLVFAIWAYSDTVLCKTVYIGPTILAAPLAFLGNSHFILDLYWMTCIQFRGSPVIPVRLWRHLCQHCHDYLWVSCWPVGCILDSTDDWQRNRGVVFLSNWVEYYRMLNHKLGSDLRRRIEKRHQYWILQTFLQDYRFHTNFYRLKCNTIFTFINFMLNVCFYFSFSDHTVSPLLQVLVEIFYTF